VLASNRDTLTVISPKVLNYSSTLLATERLCFQIRVKKAKR